MIAPRKEMKMVSQNSSAAYAKTDSKTSSKDRQISRHRIRLPRNSHMLFIEALDLDHQPRKLESKFANRSEFNLHPSHTILRTLPITPSILLKKIDESFGYLNTHFPSIRILVSNAISGYGHQSSSLEVARQLRIKGYRGRIEIFWEKGNEPSYKNLHSSFLDDMTRYPYSFEMIYNPDGVKQNKCELAITGGHDCVHSAPSDANAKVTLVLQPYQWLFTGILRTIFIEEFNKEYKRHYQHKIDCKTLTLETLAHHYQNQQTSHLLEKMYFDQLKQVGDENKFPLLNEICHQTTTKKMHLLVAYSLSRLWKPEVPILNLINGLLKARNSSTDFHKKIVILLVDDFSAHKIESITQTLGSIADICDIRELNQFNRSDKSRVTICFAGKLPEKVYTHLIEISSLPPVFEGANTTNKRLCMARTQSNIAYISFDDKQTKFLSLFDGETDRSQKRCQDLVQALHLDSFSSHTAAESNSDFISEFLVDSLNPHSLLNQYFLGCARRIVLPQNNLVTAGVLELVSHLKKESKHTSLPLFKTISPATLAKQGSIKRKHSGDDVLIASSAPLDKPDQSVTQQVNNQKKRRN